jgi:hypothetical protein
MKRRTGLLIGLGLFSLACGPTRASIRPLSPAELMDIRGGNHPTGHCKTGGKCGNSNLLTSRGHTKFAGKTCKWTQASFSTTTTYTGVHLSHHWYTSSNGYLTGNKHKNYWTRGVLCKSSGHALGTVNTIPRTPTNVVCGQGSGNGCSTSALPCETHYSVTCGKVQVGTHTTKHGATIVIWNCLPTKGRGVPITNLITCG